MENLKKGDVILIVLIIVALLFASYFLFSSNGNDATVEITTPNAQYLYPLDDDGIYTVTGYIGESVIQVKDKKVRFIDSCCKNKLCMVGSIDHNGQFLACMPNGIIASVVSTEEEGVDDVSI